MRLVVAVVVVLLMMPNVTSAQARVERNVVYGMYSGLGLLMDVYRPAQSNGSAIVAIQGSAWYSPMRYDAAALKANPEVIRHAEQFAAPAIQCLQSTTGRLLDSAIRHPSRMRSVP